MSGTNTELSTKNVVRQTKHKSTHLSILINKRIINFSGQYTEKSKQPNHSTQKKAALFKSGSI